MKTKILSDEAIYNAWPSVSVLKDDNKRTKIANALLIFSISKKITHPIDIVCDKLGLINEKKELTYFGKRYLLSHFLE